MEKQYELALKARENAYAPYSNYKVGACLVLKDGNYIIGSNVENASFGLTNCAERSALFAAVSQGYQKEDFNEIVIATINDVPGSPCGACRQVISELMDLNAKVTLINPKLTNTISLRVKDLLPYAFSGEELNEKKNI